MPINSEAPTAGTVEASNLSVILEKTDMNTISTINVPFHGNNLYVVNYNGQPYVPMRPIVEGMGMDWTGQLNKLKQKFKSTVEEISIVAADGKERNMICLALRKLAGWLHTISPNKVKAEIRDKVIQYQEECDDVLYEYWTTGEVKAKHKSTVSDRSPLVDAINLLVGKKAIAYSEAWRLVHHKFSVTSVDDLSVEDVPVAIEYVHKLALEGEYIPKEEKLPSNVKYPSDGRILLTFSHGAVEKSEVIEDGWHVMHLDSFMEIAQKAGYLVAKREDVARQIMSMPNRW